MKYVQPITNIYHVAEPLMAPASVSSNAVNGTKQEKNPGGNLYAR